MKRIMLLMVLTLGFLGCISAQTQQALNCDNIQFLSSTSKLGYNHVEKAIKHNTMAITSQNKCLVDFVLDFDPESQFANKIYVYNEEGGFDSGDTELVKGSNILEVPIGTYDILVEFIELDLMAPSNYDYLYYRRVIREQVTINQNMTLNFAASEAKNHIDFQPLTINGEAVKTGKFFVDDNWNWTAVEEPNTSWVYYQNKLFHKDYGTLFNARGNYTCEIEGSLYQNGGELFADFFVNDVSDSYVFYSYRVAQSVEDELFTSSYEVCGAMEDTIINNDPTKFVLFQDPFNISGSRYVGYELITFCLDELPIWSQTGTTNTGSIKENFNIYVSAATDNSHFNIMSFIVPEVWNYNDDGDVVVQLKSSPLIKKEDQLIISNTGVMSFPEYTQELDIMGRDIRLYQFWPSHPAFSYSIDKKKDALGNNCPVLVSNPRQIAQTFFFDLDYIGRYGETKNENKTQTMIDMKVAGEDFYSGLGSFLIDLPESLSGIIDATITNNRVTVDDLAGSNKAQIHYTAGAEDENPPTMTMLHFKDSNGDVTDRFEIADEGILEFSAGDFNQTITPLLYSAYERQMPETVEVSYSPYGEDNWNELAVEELPEYYHPGMGWFYTGSLASVTGEAYKGWFDLKIKLTDAAGNWQEQVLSPAFRIDNLAYSSVANVGSDNAREVARYSLDGKRVDANHRGVTIVKMSDGTAKKIVQ